MTSLHSVLLKQCVDGLGLSHFVSILQSQDGVQTPEIFRAHTEWTARAVVLKEWGADTLPGGGARCDGDKKNVADLSLVSESSLRSEMQRAGLTQTNQIHSFVSDPPIKMESYHLNA